MRSPIYAAWEPTTASKFYHGVEITRALPPKGEHIPSGSYAIDYQTPALPPPKERGARRQPPEHMFRATTEQHDQYKWKADQASRAEPHQRPPPEPPTAWPVVSYHGRVPPEEKAFRDAVIDEVEVQAWRTEAKVLPDEPDRFGDARGAQRNAITHIEDQVC